MNQPTSNPQTTRPLTDEDWAYWQKLVSDEHDRQSDRLKRAEAINERLCLVIRTAKDELESNDDAGAYLTLKHAGVE